MTVFNHSPKAVDSVNHIKFSLKRFTGKRYQLHF